MFRFENPSAFLWWIAIPLLIGFFWWAQRSLRKKIEAQFGGRVSGFLTASVSRPKRRMKVALQCLALFFMVIALARPQAGQSKQEIKSEGVELVFLADVSESMMAEDVRPNRLGQLKAELTRMVDLLGGNKIGLVAFAGSATLLSPLTSDPSALKMYIDSLSPLSVSSQGTNFQSALEEAEEAFKRGGVGEDDTSRVTRVIIVASDGEDHEPGAIEEAKKLAAKGFRIFTMAYGTEKGGQIPERDSLGFLKGYKKGPDGQTITTTVVGDELKKLAEAGQGEMFFASFGGNHLQRLLTALDHLEKTQFESQVATQYDEKFQIFLLFGLIAALIEFLFGERKNSFRLWRGRFEVPPA